MVVVVVALVCFSGLDCGGKFPPKFLLGLGLGISTKVSGSVAKGRFPYIAGISHEEVSVVFQRALFHT